MDLVTLDHIDMALKNCKGVRGIYTKEGRSLLISMFWTGARPVELLLMKAKHIQKHDTYKTMYQIELKTTKRGLDRKIFISQKRKYMLELYRYSKSIFPDQFMFKHYENIYRRITQKGKQHIETTNKIRYYIVKWFDGVFPGGITPYYLRHSRFSSMSENGATPEEIKHYKGARTYASVEPYLHLSTRRMSKTARTIR